MGKKIEMEQIDQKVDNIESNKHSSNGIGLDIGTSSILSCREENNETIIKRERDAFIDIEINDFTKKMIEKQGVKYVTMDDKFYILGEDSFELANILGKSVRRPMMNGLVSPKESNALPIIKLLIENIIGKPKIENELCYYSIPGKPADTEINVSYHKTVAASILSKIGYKSKFIEEGHAVVFAELAEYAFTGLGISFGGGCGNVSLSFRGMPCITFSVTRGGDWIDTNSAQATGNEISAMTALKENNKIDINDPQDQNSMAISVYYMEMIKYVLNQIKNAFEHSSNLPQFKNPIPIVCSGGSVLIKGFKEIFEKTFKQIKFPLKISDIIVPEEPLTTVARGALIACQADAEN